MTSAASKGDTDTPVIRSTDGPAAADDDELDQRVADWRRVLGLDYNPEETPK
jgi:hypothetical protein